VLVAAGIVWLTQPSSTVYATGRGQQTEILLADSSRVTMNHTSRLAVDRRLSAGDRSVTLEGEAYFRIRTTGESFIVSTSAGTIRVLGTEFNVRVREDRLEVGVVHGRVRVIGKGSGGDSSVVLAEGQETICRRGEGPGTPAGTPFAGYPGWIHGQLIFENVSLPSTCREIESRFDVVITIRSHTMQDQTLTGVLDARSDDAAIATLSRLTGLHYRHDTNGYTLY
jgi:transmembrane sensor